MGSYNYILLYIRTNLGVNIRSVYTFIWRPEGPYVDIHPKWYQFTVGSDMYLAVDTS